MKIVLPPYDPAAPMADLFREEQLNAKNTAQLVRRARKKLGLTQAELGERLGLERRTIIRFEQGEHLPTQTRLAIRHLMTLHNRKLERRAKKMPPGIGGTPTKAPKDWV